MSKSIEQAIKDRAFFYISPNNELIFLDDGDILTPSIGGGAICKAFWVKNSPQHVTLLEEVYETKEKMKSFLIGKIKVGATKDSVVELARGFGGDDFAKEIKETQDD